MKSKMISRSKCPQCKKKLIDADGLLVCKNCGYLEKSGKQLNTFGVMQTDNNFYIIMNEYHKKKLKELYPNAEHRYFKNGKVYASTH